MVAEKTKGSPFLFARLFGSVGGLSSSPSGKGDLVACIQSPTVPSMKTSICKMQKCIPELIWSLFKSLVSYGY